MNRTAVLLTLLLTTALPLTAAKRRAVRPSPNCTMVTGTGAITFTYDQGATLAPTAEPLHGIGYTYGLVALPDNPKTLFAWHRDDLLTSTDGGCSWRVAATVAGSEFPPSLVAARGGRVYVWSDNRRFLYRHDSRGTRKLKEPDVFIGIAVDPENGERLRAGGESGVIWESRDAGETWDPAGRLEAPGEIFYRVAFDPRNLDHIVAGVTRQGAFVSRDGGRTWTRATGFGKGDVNAFQFAISPADPQYVWAMAIDLEQTENAPSYGRHIYLSRDGGATYDPVVDEAPGVKLVNGPTMAAHPTNRDVLYFVFGTHTQGYGTDLFRFDYATRALTVAHNDYDDIASIAFSPVDPRLMYLGLVTESE